MNGKERMRIALSGSIPDRVPVGFFYNCDYKAALAGITPQAYIFGTNEDRYQAMAATYQRHRSDWIHADPGIGHAWLKDHRLVWQDDTPFVETISTGLLDEVLADLSLASSNGKSLGPGLEVGYSYIRLNRPLDKIKTPADLVDAKVRNSQELIQGGFLDPCQRLVKDFGEYAFITLPMSNIFFNSLYIFGLSEGLMETVTNPALIDALLDLNTEQEMEVIKAASIIGLDGVWLAEMLVSTDIVSPSQYAERIAPRHKRLVDEAHRQNLKALAYLTGDCIPLLETAKGIGYDGIVMESQNKRGGKIDIADARRSLGSETCIFGNLDPVDYMIGANEKVLGQEIERQIDVAGRAGAFVMHSNIVSLPITPEQVDTVIRLTHELGQYPIK